MKFQNPSLNFFLNGRKDERTHARTSRKQYAPYFFKVGGIIRNFKPLAILCDFTAQFASDLVGNPKDRFSHNEAHLTVVILTVITFYRNVMLFSFFQLGYAEYSFVKLCNPVLC